MGFLTNIEETFGQGGATVTVTLESAEYHWNDLLRGSVRVRGGAHGQTIRELLVRVVEHVNGGRNYSRWNTHTHNVLAAHFGVSAASEHEFPFQLRIPEQGEPTHEVLLVSYDWYVEAEAHFEHVVGAHTGRMEFLMREPPITAAIIALQSALLQVAPFRLREQTRDRAKVRYQFSPPPSAAEELDAVELTVEEVDGTVQGWLRINRKEHSLTDHLKAIVHHDITDHPLSFPAASLAESPNHAAPANVVAQLAELLRPFVTPG